MSEGEMVVPRVLINLLQDYQNVLPGCGRIPYGQLKKNWGKWGRERYWGHGEKDDE